MRKTIVNIALCLTLFAGTGAMAASGAPLVVDGKTIDGTVNVRIFSNTTYVSLREVSEALDPTAQVDWKNGRAVVRAEGLALTATLRRFLYDERTTENAKICWSARGTSRSTKIFLAI